MTRITKPSPPEHLIVVDTNILWCEDKGSVVNPKFDEFWTEHTSTFPMKLFVPEVVRGELLFQQTTSAVKLLDKVNQGFEDIGNITEKSYSHRVDKKRVKREVEERLDRWMSSKRAEVKHTPVERIEWINVINRAIWRELPFTADQKNPKNEKGFRDMMILETVCSICDFYSHEVNIAFLCSDYALRKASDERLGKIESFSSYESINDFRSFVELTKQNLTERFVKSILSKAREKFHSEKNDSCLVYKDDFLKKVRNEFRSKIEAPEKGGLFSSLLNRTSAQWEPVGREQTWVKRPSSIRVERENVYHWNSIITFVRLFEREGYGILSSLPEGKEKRLMILKVNVHWKATVGSDARFRGCEIVDYKEGEYSFEVPKVQDLEIYGIEIESEQDGGMNS